MATIAWRVFVPMAAFAQDPPQPDPDSVCCQRVVVVTARSRGESVQDVPLATSAFSDRDLEVQEMRSPL